MSELIADPELRADLAACLADELDFDLAEIRPVATIAVSTNRLFHLVAADGREAFAKLYYQDARNRLEREFGALTRLQSHGVGRVARPLLRSDEHQYGVYSFVRGDALPAAAFGPAQAAELGRFAADLSRLRALPDDPIPSARGALLALADRTTAGFDRYLASHREIVASSVPPPALTALYAELDPVAEIARLLAGALGTAGPSWHADLDSNYLRLTSGDAGVHNAMADDHGNVTVVDFEYAGWDHPLAFAADFLCHDQSLDLSPAAVAAFTSTYRAAADLPDELWAELDRARALRHIFWCAIHLNAADPAALARRRFADPSFDPDAYLISQLAKFRRRLPIAREAVARLDPSGSGPAS